MSGRSLGRTGLLTAAGRSVRIAVHPDDVDRLQLVDAVRACVAQGAVARTYAEVLPDLRAGR